MCEQAQAGMREWRTTRLDRRFVLLDEAAERRWEVQALVSGDLLPVTPEDWSSADQWLTRSSLSTVVHRRAAEWAASLLQMEAAMLLNVSAAVRPAFSERLLMASDGYNNAASLCMSLLGWTASSPPIDRFEHWAAIADIVPVENLPSILLDGRDQFEVSLEQGDRLALAGIPVALRVTLEQWQKFLSEGGWSRSETRWRFSEPLSGSDSPDRQTRRENASEDYVRWETPAALPLLEKARDALAAASKGQSSLGAARSAAEAFLFAMLEARSFTRGRFQLNASLDFHFGASAAEGDLADLDARVVVEIDGYHHFREADSYRRDRRKDSLFQEHGWFVIRFLAEDVTREIDKILRDIEYILARRVAVRGSFPNKL